MKILELFYKLRKKKLNVKTIKDSIKKQTVDMLTIKEYLSRLSCPNCKKDKTLLLVKYELGSKGWEAIIVCKECRSKGILNKTGITFDFTVNKILMEEG